MKHPNIVKSHWGGLCAGYRSSGCLSFEDHLVNSIFTTGEETIRFFTSKKHLLAAVVIPPVPSLSGLSIIIPVLYLFSLLSVFHPDNSAYI